VNSLIPNSFIKNIHQELHLQDGKEYTGHVYSVDTSSILPLQGKIEEKGRYACQWKNIFLGETRHSNFTVLYTVYPEEILETNKTVIVAVSTTFAVVLLILIAHGAVRFYQDKVNKTNLCLTIKGDFSFFGQMSTKETTSFTGSAN